MDTFPICMARDTHKIDLTPDYVLVYTVYIVIRYIA
jgi:hypothetical protein